MIRLLKVGIVLSASLLCLFYALNNVVNLESMYGALAYVMSNADHAAYPNAFGPAITAGPLIWIALIIVLIGEFGAGLILLKGAWDLFAARAKSADEFQSAKGAALMGCCIGILTWFGLFMAVGGAYFQMWQTEVGNGSHSDAFRFAAMLGIIFLIVTARDE